LAGFAVRIAIWPGFVTGAEGETGFASRVGFTITRSVAEVAVAGDEALSVTV
jgi:hypothetical protein